MNPDSIHGLLARLVELERVRDREEGTHKEMWQAINHDRTARATFEAQTEERQRELREDLSDLTVAVNAFQIEVKEDREDRAKREEEKKEGSLKSKAAYAGAVALVLTGLFGAIAQIVGHP